MEEPPQQQVVDEEDHEEDFVVDNDDLFPAWVAFNIAAFLFLAICSLVVLLRRKETRDRQSLFEFVIVIFLNTLILGGVQMDFHLTSMAILIPPSIFFFGFLLEMAILLSPSIGSILEMITRRKFSFGMLKGYNKSPLLESLAEDLMDHLDFESTVFVATEKLEDLSSEFFRNILIGGAQVSLLAAYGIGVYNKGRPDFGETTCYVYYCMGVFVQACYVVGSGLYEQTLSSFLFWCQVSLATNNGEVLEDEKGKQIVLKDVRWSLVLRSFASSAVNGWGLLWIMMLLPIQLASSEDFTDFVLNAIAVFFIVELDDLEPHKEFRYAFGYKPITQQSTIRIRTEVQVMDKNLPDPGEKFVASDNAALYMTFSTGSGSPVLKLLHASLYQENEQGEFVLSTESTRIRLPLQYLGHSFDSSKKDPRKRYESTEIAAFMITTAPGGTDPPLAMGLYQMQVEHSMMELRHKVWNQIIKGLDVLPTKPYKRFAGKIRLNVELLDSASGDPDPSASNFEATKGIACVVSTGTNEFLLVQREDLMPVVARNPNAGFTVT